MSYSGLRDVMLAKLKSGEGFSAKDFEFAHHTTIRNNTERLVFLGLAFKGEPSHRHVRWYATKEQAEAYCSAYKAAKKVHVSKGVRAALLEKSKRIQEDILELSKRPEGMVRKDIWRYGEGMACDYTLKLEREGLIFAAPEGRTGKRYFSTVAAAKAHVPKAVKATEHRPRNVGWTKTEGMIITEKTKITVCPTPPPSFKTNTYSNWG